MFARLRFSLFQFVALAATLTAATTSTAVADEFVPFVVEVSADALMVRSGPSRNYYPVTKLSAGDRVQVVGEESGWYAVIPPDDCFSLISRDYVDVETGGRTGVVNGNAVRVRAGSRLDPKKYAVQQKLSRGVEVEILGEDGEGYYKIVPPQGAVLWLHGDFVTKVDQQLLAGGPATKREPIPAAVPKAEPSPIDLIRRSSNPPTDRAAYEAPVQPIGETVVSSASSYNASATRTDPPVIQRDQEISSPVVSLPASNPKPMESDSRPSTAHEVQPSDWSNTMMADTKKPSPAESPSVVRSVPPPVYSTPSPVEQSEPVDQNKQSPSNSGIVYSFAPDAAPADRSTVMNESPRQPVAKPVEQPTYRSEPAKTTIVQAETLPVVQSRATDYDPSTSEQKNNDQVHDAQMASALSPGIFMPDEQMPSGDPSVGDRSTDDQLVNDQLASSTQSSFGSDSVISYSDEVIEHPDPYAGIDIQRDGGVIKVVVDPIEPGQELTAEEYRRRLMDLDDVFKSQLEKPAHQRDYVGMRKHFTELTDQDADMYTKMYAARRIEQINALEDASLALVKIESMSDQVTAIRRRHMLERSQLQTPRTPIERGFDAKGELRESLIYSSPVGPRRYRLVDPTQRTPRTLCYVEAAPDSEIDLGQYRGQVVGVFARDKYLQTGDVDPIAVLVAERLIVLDRGTTAPMPTTVDASTMPINSGYSAQVGNETQMQSASAVSPGYTSADKFQSASGYDAGYNAPPGIIEPDSMRTESSTYVAPPAPPVDDGEMIEMVPMDQYTPVASGGRR